MVLVDAGGTNIGSVRYALLRLGAEAELTADPERIRAASHVILPGVGAAPPGMARLREANLVEVLRGQELQELCGLDKTDYESKRTKIRRRLEKLEL